MKVRWTALLFTGFFLGWGFSPPCLAQSVVACGRRGIPVLCRQYRRSSDVSIRNRRSTDRDDKGTWLLNGRFGAPDWRTADSSASLGMTKRRGRLKGKDCCQGRRQCWGGGNGAKHPVKILDVLFDIAYKPSIEGCSWCSGGLRSLCFFRFHPDSHGASCELV